jgi:DegV family protein with EDD domain
MSKIAILTDSTANIPSDWIKQYNIQVIPLKIQWENETYLDGVDLTPNEFYQRLSSSKSLPTTSQPSIQDFLQAYEALADQADAIIVPLISSGISGTVTSAQAAASEFSRIPVEVIDTHITSMGQVLITLAIARAIAQGKNLQEVTQIGMGIIHKLQTYFAVDSLEFLQRGGRINQASRFLGSALRIHPILYFNSEGKIDALERVRTKKKAFQRLITLVEENTSGKPVHIGITHANAAQDVEEFSAEVSHRLDCREIFTVELSPVIGTHIGPGTIGISVYPE